MRRPVISEVELQPELNLSRVAESRRREGLPKIRIIASRKVQVGDTELGMIKQVVKFSAKLEIGSLGDGGELGEIQVDVLDAISKEYASPSVTEGAEGLHLKCRFVDPVVRAGIV